MEYKELVEQESQLKKSQVLYIKEVLAQNNGRVEMKYKPQEELRTKVIMKQTVSTISSRS